MADLTTSEVELHDSYKVDGIGGIKHVARHATLTLAGHGTANSGAKIPASALTLSTIKACTPLVLANGTLILLASPSADGANLLLANSTGVPANATGNFTCIVTGSPTVS